MGSAPLAAPPRCRAIRPLLVAGPRRGRRLLYVALGDSTAQGIGASSPQRGYVGLVAERLRATTGQSVRVLNLSLSGARVRDVVDEQLPRLAGLRPDVVTVAVGANDIRNYDATRFRADVDALVAGLPANAIVGDVPWFMHRGTGRDSDAAAATVALAAQARGLPVAGLNAATRRRGWPGMFTDFAADWFHPRDRGYRVWADAFWDAMAGRAQTPGGRSPMPPVKTNAPGPPAGHLGAGAAITPWALREGSRRRVGRSRGSTGR